MSRLLLQIINGIVELTTVGLDTIQMLLGVNRPLYAAANLPQFPTLDSNLRFFGGMALGLEGVLLWLLPSIERRTLLFRAVWLCAFLGSVGRLIAMPLGVVETNVNRQRIWPNRRDTHGWSARHKYGDRA